MVLMTGTTQALLREEAGATVHVGALEVRGRQEPVDAWTLRPGAGSTQDRPRGRRRFAPAVRLPD